MVIRQNIEFRQAKTLSFRQARLSHFCEAFTNKPSMLSLAFRIRLYLRVFLQNFPEFTISYSS